MTWGVGLLLAQTVGYAVGTAARMIPAVNNVLVPRIAAAASFLTSLALLWNEFLKAANIATGQVVSLAPWAFPGETSVALCGGFFSGVIAVFLPGVLSIAHTAINRAIWEFGGRFIQNSNPKNKVVSKF